MDIVSKNIAELDDNEYKQCHRLNRGAKGCMRSDLEYFTDVKHDNVDIVLAKLGDKVLGWAMVFPDGDKRRAAYFYVRADSRRKGIGTKLVETAQEFQHRPHVYEHDEQSHKFFGAVDDLVIV